MTGTINFCVDAGGSRCRARLIALDGRVLGQAEAGPCNPSTDPHRAVSSLIQVWRACAAVAGWDPEDRSPVTFAIGGAGLVAPAILSQFLSACPLFGEVQVMSDGYAALIGAGGGAPCALIVTGTGVVAHQLYRDGDSSVRDGWGWIGGDRGSGAWLGQKALRHAFKTVDGITPGDGLSSGVLEQIRCWTRDLGSWTIGLGPDRLASLVPLLLAAADAGESVATAILARAADHLFVLARTFDLAADEALFISGGLAAVMRPLLERRLGREVATPAADPIVGCFLVATGAAPPERAIDPLALTE